MKKQLKYNNNGGKRCRLLTIVLMCALVTTACNINIVSSVAPIKTGPTQTVELQVPLPEDQFAGLELNLEFAAGEMKLSPGNGDYLASGTATFNAADFEPKVQTSGATTTLRTGDEKVEGFFKCPDDVTNEWILELADVPMSLNIKAGAYDGTFELGGLSLKKLTISDVGSVLKGVFSEPNRIEMSSFSFETGGSTIALKGLANANFEQMSFTSGAGDYTLSFDGDLQRDASVQIDSGVSTMNIIVPDGVNSRLTFDGGLSTVNANGSWKQNGSVYTLNGSGPTITIMVKMGMGTLNLETE